MARPKKTDVSDPEVKTQDKGVKKRAKDPNAPKRPQTAFFLWMGENRQRIRDENPEIKYTEVAKIGGQEWNALKDKSKWENEAQAAKVQYQKDVKAFKKKNGDN